MSVVKSVVCKRISSKLGKISTLPLYRIIAPLSKLVTAILARFPIVSNELVAGIAVDANPVVLSASTVHPRSRIRLFFASTFCNTVCPNKVYIEQKDWLV